jgi:hypothetical protein
MRVEEQHAGVPLHCVRAVEELGDFSLHPQDRPCGRPPAALRPGNDTTVTGEPASPSPTAPIEGDTLIDTAGLAVGPLCRSGRVRMSGYFHTLGN